MPVCWPMALIAAEHRSGIMFWNFKVILDQAEATKSPTRGAFLFHERFWPVLAAAAQRASRPASISSLSLIPHSPAISGSAARLALWGTRQVICFLWERGGGFINLIYTSDYQVQENVSQGLKKQEGWWTHGFIPHVCLVSCGPAEHGGQDSRSSFDAWSHFRLNSLDLGAVQAEKTDNSGPGCHGGAPEDVVIDTLCLRVLDDRTKVREKNPVTSSSLDRGLVF